MKQVKIQKRKYGWKDIKNFFLLGLGHYSLIIVYSLIVFGIHYAMFGVFFDTSPKAWFTLYPLTVGPLINLSLHIWFSEKGRPYLRLLMWLNTLFMFILIPLGEF